MKFAEIKANRRLQRYLPTAEIVTGGASWCHDEVVLLSGAPIRGANILHAATLSSCRDGGRLKYDEIKGKMMPRDYPLFFMPALRRLIMDNYRMWPKINWLTRFSFGLLSTCETTGWIFKISLRENSINTTDLYYFPDGFLTL